MFEGLKAKIFERDIRERVNAELEAREEAEQQVLGDANIVLNCLRSNNRIGHDIRYDRLRSTFFAMGGTASEEKFLNALLYLKERKIIGFGGKGASIMFTPKNLPRRI